VGCSFHKVRLSLDCNVRFVMAKSKINHENTKP
jgi:hypothetical protein